jgi:hypothetical protein
VSPANRGALLSQSRLAAPAGAFNAAAAASSQIGRAASGQMTTITITAAGATATTMSSFAVPTPDAAGAHGGGGGAAVSAASGPSAPGPSVARAQQPSSSGGSSGGSGGGSSGGGSSGGSSGGGNAGGRARAPSGGRARGRGRSGAAVAVPEIIMAASGGPEGAGEYRLRVFTSDKVQAGLARNQSVYIEIMGDRSGTTHLLPRPPGYFTRGRADAFTLRGGALGRVEWVRVWHQPNGAAFGGAWNLEKVELDDVTEGGPGGLLARGRAAGVRAACRTGANLQGREERSERLARRIGIACTVDGTGGLSLQHLHQPFASCCRRRLTPSSHTRAAGALRRQLHLPQRRQQGLAASRPQVRGDAAARGP